MKKPLESYQLKDRLQQLTKSVYDELMCDYRTFIRNGNTRWYKILKAEMLDISLQEVLMFKKHLGCTAEELADPDVDLAEIYNERILQPLKDEMAQEFGIKKPQIAA